MKHIFQPDDFSGDWYGYLTNQISHVSLGVFFTWFSTLISVLMSGEFPYKWQVFFALLSIYLIYEITYQGWNGLDTIEDLTFFGVYGVGGTLLAFSEFDADLSLAMLDVQSPKLMFAILGVHLFLGSVYRWWKSP